MSLTTHKHITSKTAAEAHTFSAYVLDFLKICTNRLIFMHVLTHVFMHERL